MERIILIKAELKYISTHKYLIDELTNELNELSKELKEKENVLKKENKDVEELEKMSFKSIFVSIFQDKDEKLIKERYEASQASLEYQRVLLNYNLKDEELKRLKERIEKEDELIKELQQFYNQEDVHFKEIESALEDLSLQLKEVDEAICSGEKAFEALKVLVSFLNKADDWALFDMFSSSMIVDMVKRDHVHSAQKQLQIAQNALKSFEKELDDVDASSIDVPVLNEFDFVIDIFFDNIFIDYMINSSIGESLKKARNTKNAVKNALDHLYVKKDDLNYSMNKKKDELRDFLIKM